jgi:hypothetical protein
MNGGCRAVVVPVALVEVALVDVDDVTPVDDVEFAAAELVAVDVALDVDVAFAAVVLADVTGLVALTVDAEFAVDVEFDADTEVLFADEVPVKAALCPVSKIREAILPLAVKVEPEVLFAPAVLVALEPAVEVEFALEVLFVEAVLVAVLFVAVGAAYVCARATSRLTAIKLSTKTSPSARAIDALFIAEKVPTKTLTIFKQSYSTRVSDIARYKIQ